MHGPADAELPFNRGPLSAHSRRLEYRFAPKSAAVSFADPSGLYQLRAARYSRRTISNSSSAEVSPARLSLSDSCHRHDWPNSWIYPISDHCPASAENLKCAHSSGRWQGAGRSYWPHLPGGLIPGWEIEIAIRCRPSRNF
jgi:hypothetical protein